MGKGSLDWKGVQDNRPCASSKSQSDNYTPDVNNPGNDYKGVEDARPSSSTKSQSVSVGSGSSGEGPSKP